MDPRNYQIAALSAFVVFGIVGLDFNILLPNAIAIIGVAVLTQYCLFSVGHSESHAAGLSLTPLLCDAKSAIISALSLVLLLRTDSVIIAALAAFIAIASKRFIRIGGSHFFNPSAVALVAITAVSPHAYLSPGQWGPLGLFAFGVMGVGLLVVTRAQRLDVSVAFLLPFAALVLLRNFYLGDPPAIAWHQLQSGALLLFAFFMITDPKTTPRNKRSRIVFGVLVSILTFILQYYFYNSSAPIYALVALSPVTVLLNLYSKEHTHVKENIINNGLCYVVELQQRYSILRVLRRQS